MKRKSASLATILTSIFLGIPGLIIAGLGIIAAVGTQIPEVVAASEYNNQDVQQGALIFMIVGFILILIPVIVGIVAHRKKRTSAPVSPDQPPQPFFAQPAAQSKPIPPPPGPSSNPTVSPSAPTEQPKLTPPLPTDEVAAITARLMALNRPTAPYQIIDGKSEGVDLIAEWKIVDAQWYEVFAKASLTKVFRILLKFDSVKREVRAMDKEFSVSWRAGIPSLSVEKAFFKGQQTYVSFGTAYAFTEALAPGQVYKYRFNTNELKKPLQEAIASSGWKYKPVVIGKL